MSTFRLIHPVGRVGYHERDEGHAQRSLPDGDPKQSGVATMQDDDPPQGQVLDRAIQMEGHS